MAKLKHLISKNKKKLDNIAKILFCLIEIFCFIKFHYRVIFNNICDGIGRPVRRRPRLGAISSRCLLTPLSHLNRSGFIRKMIPSQPSHHIKFYSGFAFQDCQLLSDIFSLTVECIKVPAYSLQL